MTTTTILEFTARTMQLILVLSMLPIAVATVVGVLVSMLQALTQIQEQTLGFAIKLVAITITLLVTARWLGSELYQFTISIFDSIPGM